MTLLLLFIVFLSAIIHIIQYNKRQKHEQEIRYLTEKLNEIRQNESTESLLLVTDHYAMKDLLIEINRLLDHQRQSIVKFTRKERSIKKMLANISHDLKTPLTVVLGYIETMQNRQIPTKEKDKLLYQMNEKTMEIIHLMNTFFDLAKLEAGDKKIPLSRVNINEVCKSNLLLYYDLVQAQRLEAVVQMPEQPIFAWGNEEALNRVLNNLLSNALRYGSDGKVIGLSLDSDDNHVYISVWDRGQGISEANHDRVFERMFTLEESRNKSFHGSGLGLTITKRLVEEMGGNITLQSKPYEKTTFTFTLKRATY